MFKAVPFHGIGAVQDDRYFRVLYSGDFKLWIESQHTRLGGGGEICRRQ